MITTNGPPHTSNRRFDVHGRTFVAILSQRHRRAAFIATAHNDATGSTFRELPTASALS
jgi:hypothetical protein